MSRLGNLKSTGTQWRILLLSAVITIIGLITLNGISYSEERVFNNPFFKQSIFLIPSLICCISVTFIPRFIIHKYGYFLYSLGIIIVFLPFLTKTHVGTHRWLDVGLPFAIQTSEFTKIFIIIALARYLSDRTLVMKKFKSILLPFILAIIPSVIVLKQPDLGTSIIMMIPVLPMLYWSGARPFHLFLVIAPFLSIIAAFNTLLFTFWAILIGVTIFLSRTNILGSVLLFFGNLFLGLLTRPLWDTLKPYQQNRVLTLLDPDKDPLGAAYQIIQSKTAIGSGGVFGKGWGEGTQTHLKFLPVQESDFILSVIGEEFGFIAISFILLCFAILIHQVINSAYISKDRFSSLALIGLSTILMSHVFVNTAMTVGLIPVKGLPLPFISAGGSFLIATFTMIGLILRLSNDELD